MNASTKCGRRRRLTSVLLMSALGLPIGVSGQIVQGHLRDAATRAPVEGALVLLLDVTGRRVAGTLTDQRGAFGIVAPGAGRYTVQAERIGFATAASEPFPLAANEVHAVELFASAMAVSLEGLEVEGRKRCVVRPEEGAALSRVWGEAQKALRNQEWTDGNGPARFRLRRYEREYDAGMRFVTSEREVFSGWTGGNPIRSLPAEDLLANGFVRGADDGGWEYYGPDASVLLSDAFLDTHCFELSVDEHDPEVIGLAFEPIRGRRVADISGTFWLTRSDARLRFLEFVYTSAPWPEAARVASGRVEFDELPGGQWVVRQWWIRMPRMERDMALMVGGLSGLRVGGILEVGGTATQVGVPRAPSLAAAGAGTIEGMVWDSTRGRPLVGAQVRSADGAHSGVTDAAGRFTLEALPDGAHELLVRHPRLDSLPMAPAPVSVTVTHGATAEVRLAVPSLASMIATACRGGEGQAGSSIVLGTVTWGAAGDPVAGATVTLEWSDYEVIAGREVRSDVHGLRVTSNARGRYAACGIPPGVLLSVKPSVGDVVGRVVEKAVPRDGMVTLDLRLPPRR
jgi:hypothetical protein